MAETVAPEGGSCHGLSPLRGAVPPGPGAPGRSGRSSARPLSCPGDVLAGRGGCLAAGHLAVSLKERLVTASEPGTRLGIVTQSDPCSLTSLLYRPRIKIVGTHWPMN